MSKRLIAWLKFAWAVLVFAGAGWYLFTHFDEIAGELSRVAAWRLAAAVLLLVGGKLLLVQLSRDSVQLSGGMITYRQMFAINATTQLAKYLPGGIWHFVGRAGYYHAAGLKPGENTQAIVVENVWLVSSAGLFGTAVFALYALEITVALVVVAGVIMLAGSLNILLLGWRGFTPSPGWLGRLLLLQGGVWLLLGLSLWSLLPFASGSNGLLLAVSAFALSWVIGYATVFAPSGLGVREVVLVVLLGTLGEMSIILVYATINRLVWVITEMLLAIVAHACSRPQVHARQPDNEADSPLTETAG